MTVTAVRRIEGVSADQLSALLRDASEPLVLAGFCAHWPLVELGLQSAQAALDFIAGCSSGEPVAVAALHKEAQGRVFYNADQTGFNYSGGRVSFAEFGQQLLALAAEPDGRCLYMGSTEVSRWFPGLLTQHQLPLSDWQPLTSLWIGNQAQIAAHYDFPHNLACNLVGQREFLLFPPQQVANLYPGPMEFAPGGHDVSMVDFNQPDFARFPKAREALQAAQLARLEPGDLLFIPSMWWHQVTGKAAVNVLLTHWWRDTPGYLGRPNNALLAAVLGIRSLPKAQRQAWQALFNYYVFDHDEVDQQQISSQALGMLEKPLPELEARKLRADLLNKLKR